MGKKAKPQKKKTTHINRPKEVIDHPKEDCSRKNVDSEKKQDELQNTLNDFSCKDNWDKFFNIRGEDDSFEWYGEWNQLGDVLTAQLQNKSVRILVPGCGNSKLSEHLYDAGFKDITNIDFSKVVIMNMLKRNVRSRPEMMWRTMDMTTMKFEKLFDVVLDKGGLDALMEPKLGPKLGYQYLSKVKRVLKTGGKYVCLTLAEAHILDLLFPMFRFGWKMSLQVVASSSSSSLKYQTFMVVAEKDGTNTISDISFMDKFDESPGEQVCGLREALEREKKIRSEHSTKPDKSYSLQDLLLGAMGDISFLEPGRRIEAILKEPGVSHSVYNSILLDAREGSGSFAYHYGIFIVSQQRAHDWLFSSEEGQWLTVASAKAARLLMVILDSSNSNYDMEYIKKDLSPLVKQLAPEHDDDNVQIPFMTAGDGLTEREVVHEVTSAVTGKIVVEDVVYEESDDEEVLNGPKYRRLTFQRTENLVQSEALLSSKYSESEVENGKEQEASKSVASSRGDLLVVHDHLASSYHIGIISGILLIFPHFKISTSVGGPVKAVVIGLGAGLLPMFMKKNLPSLMIEVVELDPVVLSIARKFFGFVEDDDRLKVHITDGIKFVEERTDKNNLGKIDILIVDVDSADASSGLTCPALDFVEGSFISKAKESLSEQGLFIINLVSRSGHVKDSVKSRMKEVFGSSSIYSLQLQEDVNEVIFAMKTECPMEEEQLCSVRDEVGKSLVDPENYEWKLKVLELSKSISRMEV